MHAETMSLSNSLLILGAPGVGKTTLLRDVAFQLAETFEYVMGGRCVAVAVHSCSCPHYPYSPPTRSGPILEQRPDPVFVGNLRAGFVRSGSLPASSATTTSCDYLYHIIIIISTIYIIINYYL